MRTHGGITDKEPNYFGSEENFSCKKVLIETKRIVYSRARDMIVEHKASGLTMCYDFF